MTCSSCGFRNQGGTDFCVHCRSYLGYEEKEPDGYSRGVAVALEPSVLAVKPGDEATCDVHVRNQSNIVDQYEIQLSGEPSGWAFAEPSMLSLFPDTDGVAKLRFRPQRSVEPVAGRKPFSITVQSKTSPAVSARQDGEVEVASFREAALTVTPRNSRGSVSGSHRVSVENRGNGPLHGTLEATDPDELLMFRFDNQIINVMPGQTGYTNLVVSPRSTLPEGPPQVRPFKIRLTADALSLIVSDATMLQEAVAPSAVPSKRRLPIALLLIPVLLLLAAFGALAIPRFVSGDRLASTGPAPIPATGPSKQDTVSPSPQKSYALLESSPPGALVEIGFKTINGIVTPGTGRIVGPTPTTVELIANDVDTTSVGSAIWVRMYKDGYIEHITGITFGPSGKPDPGRTYHKALTLTPRTPH